MKVHKLGIVALALTFVLSAPVASAAFLAGVDCQMKGGDQAQCVEQTIQSTIGYEHEDPIGVVAYATPRCSYFIVQADDRFVIARDVDKKDDVRRGDAIFANPSEDGTDFKRGKSPLMVGTTVVRTLILSTHDTAHDAATAYAAKCGR